MLFDSSCYFEKINIQEDELKIEKNQLLYHVATYYKYLFKKR
jgi:hypothetical protein